jgi:hypothetical protein
MMLFYSKVSYTKARNDKIYIVKANKPGKEAKTLILETVVFCPYFLITKLNHSKFRKNNYQQKYYYKTCDR